MVRDAMTVGPELSDAQFSGLMKGFGPFEPNPCVAVGVSGGADSLAAMMLLKSWLDVLDGRLLALTVDHGLRPGSREEADYVGALCRSLGIEHVILTWRGERPKSGIQAAAREARYRLLSSVCRERGILHLVLAHHLDDQVETFLLRLARGSTLLGLSAMAPIRYHADFRLLRPFLTTPATRLRATCASRKLSWIDDPSNDDMRYARIRMRRLAALLPEGGVTEERLALAARRLARYRRDKEAGAADLVARAIRLSPEGHAQIESGTFFREDEAIRMTTLSRLLSVIGGTAYGPRAQSLQRFYAGLRGGPEAVATLCRVRAAREGDAIRLVRESRNLPTLPLPPDVTLRWDNRFDVRVTGAPCSDAGPAFRVAALGRKGWAALPPEFKVLGKAKVPPAARPSLPALWDDFGLISQPHIGYNRTDRPFGGTFSATFRPETPLTGLFTLV